MNTFEHASKYFVDHCDARGRYSPISGPFESLAEAMTEFERMAPSIKLRLRGPNNRVYAASHAGEIFRHNPPRKFTNAR